MNLVYFSLTHAQLCLPPGMLASQDNFLNQGEYEVPGEALLVQSAQYGEVSSEIFIAEYMRFIESLESPNLDCEKCDLYGVSSFTNPQTLSYTEALTQEDVPVIPGFESQLSAPHKYSQDFLGQGDQVDSSPSDQESLQKDSKEIESSPHQVKPNIRTFRTSFMR